MSDPIDAIDPQVLIDFPVWLKQPEIEGFVSNPYCDSVGVVTGGSGLAFFSTQDMGSVQWSMTDGSLASNDLIVQAYNGCKALFDLHREKPLAAGAYANMSPIRISQAENAKQVLRWLSTRMGIVLGFFPDFEHYPRGVQMGILDMAYNMGAACFKIYPHLRSYINALDWEGASKECATVKGPVKRNQMRAVLFTCDS